MQIVQVIPITKSIDTEVLSYFSAKSVPPGTLVSVPLRKQNIRALVVESEDVRNIKAQLRGAHYQIRNISEIYDTILFSPEFLSTISLVKNYYLSTTGRLIDHIIPRIITRSPEEFSRPNNQGEEKREHFKSQHLLLQQKRSERVSHYRVLIREKFSKKESLHIFCPTQESAISLYLELLKNNEEKIFLLHGGMTKKAIKESLTKLYEQANREPTCVISTPGFLDVYQTNLTAFIIEEEASEYYYTVSEPFLDYRIIFEHFADAKKIECIWADSILRPETYIRRQNKTAECIEPFIKNILSQHSIEYVQLHTQGKEKQTDAERIKTIRHKEQEYRFFHVNTEKALHKAIRNKQKVFIFVPKKSLAPNIVCGDCGNIARSSESGFPYSLFIKNKERIFVCQRTGEQVPAFDMCQFCNGWKLTPLGLGTETIQDYLLKKFPRLTTYIVDSVHTKTKKSIQEIRDAMERKNKALVIIGTQKAIPLFAGYDLSIFLGLDVYFSRMNYAVQTLLLKRILDVSEKSSHVLIQSRNILETFLPVLQDGMYPPFIKEELSYRKTYNYPPFATIIKIVHTVDQKIAKQEFKKIYQYYHRYDPHIVGQPAPKKRVYIIVLLTLSLDQWNINYQDPALYERLISLDRKTKIYVNPTDLY